MKKIVKKILPKKVTAGLDVLQTGKRVANPAAWKKGQVTVEILSAFVWAILAALSVYFNVDIEVGEDVVNSASGAIIAIVAAVERLYSAYTTVATTNKIGLPKSESNDTEQL